MLNWKCKFYGRCVRCSMLHEVCLADHSKRVILCCQEIANFWQRITLWKSAANSTLCMIKTLKYKNDHIYHQKQSIFENKFLKTSTAVHVWCIYLISGPCGGFFVSLVLGPKNYVFYVEWIYCSSYSLIIIFHF